MPFIVIIIGAILVIAAFNETHGDLAIALEQDIPGYFKWAAAIGIILGLGFIPALRTPSRWLTGLVVLVVILTNYKQMIQGFTQFASADTTAGTGNPDPTAAYVTSGGTGGVPTQTQIAGEAGGPGPNAPGGGATDATAAAPLPAGQKLAANPFNPSSYTGAFSGFGGSGLGG